MSPPLPSRWSLPEPMRAVPVNDPLLHAGGRHSPRYGQGCVPSVVHAGVGQLRAMYGQRGACSQRLGGVQRAGGGGELEAQRGFGEVGLAAGAEATADQPVDSRCGTQRPVGCDGCGTQVWGGRSSVEFSRPHSFERLLPQAVDAADEAFLVAWLAVGAALSMTPSV